MEPLRSFSSRLLIGANDDEYFDHEPEDVEKQWAIQRCMELSEYDESNTIIIWIKKIKQSQHKQDKRLMVITDIRLFTARRGGSKKKPKFEIKREAHILSLISVQQIGVILHIHFKDFQVSFECNNDDLTQKILGQLYINYTFYNPGFTNNNDMACKWLDQYKTSKEGDLRKEYAVIGDSLSLWEKPARSFRSYAYFYKEINKDKLSLGLKSILRRPLDDMIINDERWLYTKSLKCQNPKTIYGAILCIAFTLDLLHGVEISGIKGDNDLFFAIKMLLKYNTTLNSLILDGCSNGPKWGGLMINAMMENPNIALKRFGLKNCGIGDKGVNLWIEGNKKLQRHPTCIYLTKANCSNKTMINFIQSLPESSGGSSGYIGGDRGLEELDLSQNSLDSKGTHVLANRLIKDFHTLKMLNLEKCNVDCARLLTAIEQASKKGLLALEEINLSYNKMTQQDGLILSRILSNTKTCASLGLAGCGLSGQTIVACLASLLSNESLRLDVSDNNIGYEAAIMFASIFVYRDRIMSLKLNNCNLTHEGMGYILNSLLTQPRLKLLEIDYNCKRSQWNSGKYHVNQMLGKLLEKCLNLQSLSIKNDPERGYQVDLDDFLCSLKTNDCLISLNISGNSMTSDNLAALKDVVIRNGVLRELYWDENNITSKHILGITHALKQNKALQIVEFPNKDFQKELIGEKSTDQKMKLQIIKKDFYRAIFENATTQGFQQSITNYKRPEAKRASFIMNRSKNQTSKPQIGGNTLNLTNNNNNNNDDINRGGMLPSNPINRGGIRRPPLNLRMKPKQPVPTNNNNKRKPPLNQMNNNNNNNNGYQQYQNKGIQPLNPMLSEPNGNNYMSPNIMMAHMPPTDMMGMVGMPPMGMMNGVPPHDMMGIPPMDMMGNIPPPDMMGMPPIMMMGYNMPPNMMMGAPMRMNGIPSNNMMMGAIPPPNMNNGLPPFQ